MTRAPPVTEIMGQPHLWGEFLVLMLSFFLEWYSHSRNLCLSCMGALPKSRGSRRCRRPPHPPSSHSFSSRPFHFSHIPHIPPHPSLFLHPSSCTAFLRCVALSVFVGPWFQRATAQVEAFPNMPGDALIRAPPYLPNAQKSGFVCIESAPGSTASPLPAGKPEEVEA